MNKMNSNISFRKSHYILILRLVALEVAFVALYLLVRISKIIIISTFQDFTSNQLISYIGIVYFIALSVIELVLVAKISLDWSNEVYEIREDSLVHRKGVFHLKQQTYTLRNLGSANIYQGFLGKILNYGTIIITSPILKNDIVLIDIHNPQRILKSFEDNIDESSVKDANIIKRAF